MKTIVPITSPDLDAAEVSWLAALCSDDYQFLGVPDGVYRSSWEHCSDIPHIDEAEYFGRLVMPHLKTCSMPHEYGRVPREAPLTPLANGVRK